MEYKDLMKKGAFLRYMMQNLYTSNAREILIVHMRYKYLNQGLKIKHGNNYAKIMDFENNSKDILHIFSIKLMINMHLKYQSPSKEYQEDAFKSALLLAVIAGKFLQKRVGVQT